MTLCPAKTKMSEIFTTKIFTDSYSRESQNKAIIILKKKGTLWPS